MYIAMNRFKIAKGKESDFENVWKSRNSRLSEMPGFVEFRLLRGPEAEDHTLYSSHTLWNSYEEFEVWTRSEQFRDAHKNAGNSPTRAVILGHPQFEGFHTIVLERNDGSSPAAAAE